MTLMLIPSKMIYYSHVNEDNRVERELLQRSNCKTVIAVAGSGERILALLDNMACQEFHAVDVNEEALFLLELKVVVLRHLTVEQYLEFCGHKHCKKKQRHEWFEQVKPELSAACKMHWEKHISLVENGIIYCGHFERFLQRVRPFVVQFLGKNFLKILSGTALNANEFPKRRWKFVMRIFSQRWIYKAWGNKDVAFVGDDSFIRHIPDALDQTIRRGDAASSFITHLIFNGHLRDMKEENLPPSLRKEVLKSVKERLGSGSIILHFHHADLLQFVGNGAESTHGVFYSISDILSFEGHDYLQKLLNKTGGAGNLVVWRTFLRNRIDGDFENVLKTKYHGLTSYTSSESTGMYQVFAMRDNDGFVNN